MPVLAQSPPQLGPPLLATSAPQLGPKRDDPHRACFPAQAEELLPGYLTTVGTMLHWDTMPCGDTVPQWDTVPHLDTVPLRGNRCVAALHRRGWAGRAVAGDANGGHLRACMCLYAACCCGGVVSVCCGELRACRWSHCFSLSRPRWLLYAPGSRTVAFVCPRVPPCPKLLLLHTTCRIP